MAGVGKLVQDRFGRRVAAPCVSRAPRVRMPLSLVVGRYFVYVLLGALVLCGIPLVALWLMISAGTILPANWGPAHVDEVAAELAAADAFDAQEVPAAYGFVVLDAEGGQVLAGDAAAAQLDQARRAVSAAHGASATSGEVVDATTDGGMYPTAFRAVQLQDGTWCVLSYQLLPQWSSREMRDTWPNPQTVVLAAVLAALVAVIVGVALRASHVLTRKMRPLVRAADAVGARELDFTVERSNVAQVDDVLAAMDRMRASLKTSLEEQWAAEQERREQVTLLAHQLKTPLTVMLGNTELLLEELGEQERLLGQEELEPAAVDDARRERLEELRALRAAALEANACVGRLISASRGMGAQQVDADVPADAVPDTGFA